jgi:hypothetical protein
MRRQIVVQMIAAGAFVVVACASRPAAAASDPCFYRGTMFSDGAKACQSGKLFKCDDGEWKASREVCEDTSPMKLSRACDFGGVSYSTGSASCQEGTQYRCEDGTWRRLGMTCPVADAPIRVIPSGRTCMFDGATVANNSTICRSESTYLCSDGAWVNLGTQCR